MRKSITQFTLRFTLLLCAALTLGFNAAAQSESKSNTSNICYTSLDCVPAAGSQCCPDTPPNTKARQSTTKPVSTWPLSKFTLANKSGGSNSLRTAGKAISCSTEVTVSDVRGVIQSPDTWFLRNDGEVLVVNLSALPKGKYKVKVQSGKDVEEYEVTSPK